MRKGSSVRAVELLIEQAWGARDEGRYRHALTAAERAVEAAEQLDDPNLLVRALNEQGEALRLLGAAAGALPRFTRILALAEDPASGHRLDDPKATRVIARAYMQWVECARFTGGIPVRRLFEVLDAAEQWLVAIGHRDWRAGALRERAVTHYLLGQMDQALVLAEEALAADQPGAPGYSKATYRLDLGDMLREVGRDAEAAGHYQAVLDDPESNSYERRRADVGLAWCALAREELGEARRYAVAAVRLAEALGDNALCSALGVLVAVCRREGDLEQAWEAATRWVDAARQVDGHVRSHRALQVAVDVALDRGELVAAGELLEELEQHAAALDADTGRNNSTKAVADRRTRLQRLLRT
jgi:tetratricopeptide (TPR) repeat protein